jgi:hypothetical protein
MTDYTNAKLSQEIVLPWLFSSSTTERRARYIQPTKLPPFALMLGMDVKTPGYSRSAHARTGKVLPVSGRAAVVIETCFLPGKKQES